MEQIHKDLLKFLGELKENNHKDWFENNRKRYEDIRKSHITFVADLIKLSTAFEPKFADLIPSKSIFRMNRDVRFSKDKSPYKVNMGAWISVGGKELNAAGYYLHLEPNNCFIGGGIYMPLPPQLKLIRQEIDYNLADFKNIVESKSFIKNFNSLSGDKLKTAPKDYPKDHEGIEYLKHKDFLATKKYSDEEVLDPDFLKHVVSDFQLMSPLVTFINTALVPAEEE